MVTYAVASLRTMEFLALAALHLEHRGQIEHARRFASLCARVVSTQAGCIHPISDRFAACFPPVIAVLRRFGRAGEASKLLRTTTKWVCDRYEQGFGLASTYSTPEEEIKMLLGVPFDSIKLKARRESQLAVALADSAHSFVPKDYPLITNEFQAVGVTPSSVHANDAPGAYVMNGGSTQSLTNVGYPDTWAPIPLPHQMLQANQ